MNEKQLQMLKLVFWVAVVGVVFSIAMGISTAIKNKQAPAPVQSAPVALPAVSAPAPTPSGAAVPAY